MEKAAAGAHAGSRGGFGVAGRWLAGAGWCCMAAPLWAQVAPDATVADARIDPPRLEVKTSTLPQLDAQEPGGQAQRVDVALLPGATGLGVAVGMSSFAAREGIQPLGSSRPTLDFGLHLRQVVHSSQIDITAWRRMTAEPDAYTLIQQRQPVYGARVEMRLDAVRKTSFTAERGFLGLQLESGAKISIKRRNGGPMFYYRNTF